MSTKWWTGNLSRKAAAVSLAVLLMAAGGCALLPKEQQEEQLPEITPPTISKKPEYEVTTATLETKVQAVGKLISLKEETLYYTLDGKRLKNLYITPGQKVQAGQVIAELDVEDLTKNLRSQKLQFRKDETAMKETLAKRDTMDPVEFEEAKIAFEEKRQAIADLEVEIAKATLTAPFAGTIVQLNVQKGDLIKAYDPVCIVADTAQLVPAAKFTQDDLAQVAAGMPVVVEINNAGQFTGKVKQLPVTTADDNNGGGNGGNGGGNGNGGSNVERPQDFLLVQLDKTVKNASRGTPLSISIITKRKENAVVIPLSALRTLGSRNYVQVAEGETKREVDVEIGQQTATQVEILNGLTPGMKVVGR